MIQAQLQLYLTSQGQEVFTDWLRFFGKVVRQFPGFINIQMLRIEKSAASSMVVIFESKQQMDSFFDSKIFAQLMKHMEVHSVHPYNKIVYRAKNMYAYKKPSPTRAASSAAAKAQAATTANKQTAAATKMVAKNPLQSSTKTATEIEVKEDTKGSGAKTAGEPAVKSDINTRDLASFMRARQMGKSH